MCRYHSSLSGQVHPAGCDIVRGQQRARHLRGPGPTVLPQGSAGGAQCPVAAAQGHWRRVREPQHPDPDRQIRIIRNPQHSVHMRHHLGE